MGKSKKTKSKPKSVTPNAEARLFMQFLCSVLPGLKLHCMNKEIGITFEYHKFKIEFDYSDGCAVIRVPGTKDAICWRDHDFDTDASRCDYNPSELDGEVTRSDRNFIEWYVRKAVKFIDRGVGLGANHCVITEARPPEQRT